MANHIPFPEDRVPSITGREYYLARGITEETIDACGIKIASKQACLDALKSKRSTNYKMGFIIPYDEDYNYCTVRWLGDNLSGFNTRLKNDPKLLAPAGDLRVYVPPIVNDETFDGDLYLCESAFKAVALAQQGYYAIAGNGVDGLFTGKGMTQGFPHGLFDGEVVKRVFILFDSDWSTNKRVQGAVRRQTIGLRDEFGRGFEIWHKQLTHEEGGEPWGIDDAIAARGIEWLHGWLGSDQDQVDSKVEELYIHYEQLNEQYTVCKVPLCIIPKATGELYNRGGFTDLLESKRTFKDKVNGRWQEISPAKEWLKWDEHNMVDRLAYLPGCECMGTDDRGSYFNSWTDCGVKAQGGGDIEPFLKVYKNAIPDKQVRQLLLESLAWMLQNRDKKLDKAFLLIGSQVGTGKSLLAQIMGECVGHRNFSSIGMEDFTGNFNGPFVEKEVILMDDVVTMPKSVAGKFRRYVTDRTILVNPKGVKQYSVDNQAVWFLTANKYRALPMDENERRVLVVDFNPTVHYPTGTAWWDKFIVWLDGGGYGIVRHWLENLDISDYDPNFMPPMTEAKIKVQEATREPEEQFVIDLREDPSSVLAGVKRSVFTIQELWSIFVGADGDMYSAQKAHRLADCLKESSFKQAHDGKLVRNGGKGERYWVICNTGQSWTLAKVKADLKSNVNITPSNGRKV